ncbi:hypothetical protein OS493_030871 [Desmophyllum pertusum]|uniref:Uncharacterized protein n=1 Tax=Desmophyllum pertusum TaxID=174260 RepID=A0A9X0CCR0_9CNID|nr:hypothetical protein OS493_030871 [Desmophyllum pertusum]
MRNLPNKHQNVHKKRHLLLSCTESENMKERPVQESVNPKKSSADTRRPRMRNPPNKHQNVHKKRILLLDLTESENMKERPIQESENTMSNICWRGMLSPRKQGHAYSRHQNVHKKRQKFLLLNQRIQRATCWRESVNGSRTHLRDTRTSTRRDIFSWFEGESENMKESPVQESENPRATLLEGRYTCQVAMHTHSGDTRRRDIFSCFDRE